MLNMSSERFTTESSDMKASSAYLGVTVECSQTEQACEVSLLGFLFFLGLELLLKNVMRPLSWDCLETKLMDLQPLGYLDLY